MHNMDEKIIRALVSAQAAKQHTISGTVAVDGMQYQFEEREFPPDYSLCV